MDNAELTVDLPDGQAITIEQYGTINEPRLVVNLWGKEKDHTRNIDEICSIQYADNKISVLIDGNVIAEQNIEEY